MLQVRYLGRIKKKRKNIFYKLLTGILDKFYKKKLFLEKNFH